MERLVKSVVRDLLEALTRDGFGRGCKDYTDSCKEYLETYGDTNADCGHKCEYCSKFKWAVDRAKHYEEKLGIPWKEVLKSWEDDRSYWFLNYYQDCNQPLIESDNVFVFENAAELRAKCGKQFICPHCKGISTNPYECNSGNEVNGKICCWKAYGFLRFGLCFCYCKEERKGTHIFMPVALQKTEKGEVNNG